MEDNQFEQPSESDKEVAPAHSNWVVVDNCAHVIMWNYPELTVDFIKRTAKV